MKRQFLKLIFDFVDKFPQIDNGKINYVFCGSIATNLLSFVSKKKIKSYNLTDKFYIEERGNLKVNRLFKDYFRLITDIDVELYNKTYFGKNRNDKFVFKELDFNNYSSCFRDHINDIYLDTLNSKSNTIYEIIINDKKIYIEDFYLTFGYRLKTFAKLSEDRFVKGHFKYEFTKNKYKFDINFMCNLYFQCFKKDKIIDYIKNGLTEFLNDNADSPKDLYLNILLRRIKWLNLHNKNEKFLVKIIEQLKLDFYKNKFYNDDIFLLNVFSDVSNIEYINLGKSKNRKYKIIINDKIYLLKSNCFLDKDNLEKRIKIIKRINKYMPNNSQNLEFYGYSDDLNEAYIVYKYIEGKSLNEVDTKELLELGKKTGPLLYQFHHISIKGLSLKNENKFLTKVKKESYKGNVGFSDEELVKSIIKNNDAPLKGKYLLHNDLNLGNIIYDGEKIILIDFDNCSKGDWIIDFKRDIKNNNDFFDGLFLGYGKERSVYNYKLKLVLALYEFYYMKQLLNKDCVKRSDILERHEQFLDFFEKDTK